MFANKLLKKFLKDGAFQKIKHEGKLKLLIDKESLCRFIFYLGIEDCPSTWECGCSVDTVILIVLINFQF